MPDMTRLEDKWVRRFHTSIIIASMVVTGIGFGVYFPNQLVPSVFFIGTGLLWRWLAQHYHPDVFEIYVGEK